VICIHASAACEILSPSLHADVARHQQGIEERSMDGRGGVCDRSLPLCLVCTLLASCFAESVGGGSHAHTVGEPSDVLMLFSSFFPFQQDYHATDSVLHSDS
jgi:hypothetical protein